MTRLIGGVAPYMMGLVVGVAVVSTLTGNQARLINEQNQNNYIQEKKEYAQKLAESLKTKIFQEQGSSNSSFNVSDTQKYVHTNVFDSNNNSAQLTQYTPTDGETEVALSIDSNSNTQHSLSNPLNAKEKIADEDSTVYLDEQSLRKIQINKSFENLKEEISALYNNVIDQGIVKFPDDYSATRTDVWGNGFTYEKVDDFNAKLSFNTPWDASQDHVMKIRLPEIVEEAGTFAKIETLTISGNANYNSTYVLTSEGTLYATGKNDNGHFGLGNLTDQHSFVKIPVPNVADFATNGASMYIITKTGELWAAGRNSTRELGLGSLNAYETTFLKTIVPNAKSVALSTIKTSEPSVMVLTETGDVWGAGNNQHYSLGIPGNSGYINTFTKLNLSNIKKIYNLFWHAFAISDTGELFVAGRNNNSALGTDNGASIKDWKSSGITGVKKLIALEEVTIALTDDGRAYGAGSDVKGMLGMGGGTYGTFIDMGLSDIRDITAFSYYQDGSSFVIFNDGTAKAAGNNDKGQLGVGSTNSMETYWVDIPVDNIKSIKKEKKWQTYLLRNNGEMYAAGYNYSGDLCVGDKVDKNTFTKINIANAKEFYVKDFSVYIIDNTGTLYTCANNDYYQLGLGDNNDRVSPTETSVTNAIEFTANKYHGSVITSEDKIYSAGRGDNGGLGTGSTATAPYWIEVTIPGLGDSCSYNPTEPATQTCPAGYTNNGSVCTHTTVRNNIGYGCESGSDYNGGCYVRTGFASCPSGWALKQTDDTMCYETATVHNQPCSSGFTVTPGGRCAKYMNRPCPSGFTLQADRICRKKLGNPTYLCDSGFYLSGTKCYRTQTTSITYTCDTGTLNGTICEIPKPDGC